MGFDLTAKNKRLGEKGYLRANVYQMILFRASMLAAGVDEDLVYGRFVSNDGLFVTALQSRKIADRLTGWLRGRKLMVSLSERNGVANAANEAYFEAFRKLGGPGNKRAVKQFAVLKSHPFRLDLKARKVVRDLAEFSNRSGGFWVS
ncbi:MAG: hypothetical protein ACRD4X_02300 [Candidatus Acidiferrales bacterium]